MESSLPPSPSAVFLLLSLPVLIFPPADSVTFLKEWLALLPLLSFTSGFSVQLPVSHKHLPGSGCFGTTVRNNSIWLIQHCCLIDHSDQVLEADAPTDDLFTLRLGLELT